MLIDDGRFSNRSFRQAVGVETGFGSQSAQHGVDVVGAGRGTGPGVAGVLQAGSHEIHVGGGLAALGGWALAPELEKDVAGVGLEDRGFGARRGNEAEDRGKLPLVDRPEEVDSRFDEGAIEPPAGQLGAVGGENLGGSPRFQIRPAGAAAGGGEALGRVNAREGRRPAAGWRRQRVSTLAV